MLAKDTKLIYLFFSKQHIAVDLKSTVQKYVGNQTTHFSVKILPHLSAQVKAQLNLFDS